MTDHSPPNDHEPEPEHNPTEAEGTGEIRDDLVFDHPADSALAGDEDVAPMTIGGATTEQPLTDDDPTTTATAEQLLTDDDPTAATAEPPLTDDDLTTAATTEQPLTDDDPTAATAEQPLTDDDLTTAATAEQPLTDDDPTTTAITEHAFDTPESPDSGTGPTDLGTETATTTEAEPPAAHQPGDSAGYEPPAEQAPSPDPSSHQPPHEPPPHDPSSHQPPLHQAPPPDPSSHQPPPHQPPPHMPPPAGGGTAPGAGYPPARRLYRSRHDRRLGGVAGGVAEYLNVDPTIVRLATFLLAFTGVGFLLYLAAWLIVPLRPEGFVEAATAPPFASERTMTFAFGIAALALAFGIVTDSWEVLAIALIGGGIWLLSERPSVRPGLAPAGASPGSYAPHGPDPSAPMPYSSAPRQYDDLGYPTSPTSTLPPAPPPYTPPEPKERRRQNITWLVLSLLGLLTAVGVAAATGDWWNVSATRFLGIGVVIIVLGVVAGQIKGGGARGLIPLGILAMLLVFPVSVVDGLLDDGVGQATFRPTSFIELEDDYQHGIGKLTVDLSQLDFEGRTESLDIELGIGELIVIVSEDTGGQAVLQAKAGEVSHFLPRTNSFLFEDGVNIETGTVRLEGEDGTLVLDIDVGLGTAELRSRPG